MVNWPVLSQWFLIAIKHRNKFCFTGGYLVSSVQLPGINNIVGLWPAVWAMGNLGRAGYGSSLDGMWPYTYDSCDVGTAPNQTINGLPAIAQTSGAEDANYVLSYLPGQRLSRCTCDGQSHPGPKHSDGTYVGRAAPEIDVFEAQVSDGTGSSPFDAGYVWDNNTTISKLNTYIGGKTQQATSLYRETNQECYQLASGCLPSTDLETVPLICFEGYASDNAYISWINDGKLAWTINAAGVGANTATEHFCSTSWLNLGMSTNFGEVDLDHITFPAGYDPDNINIGCDPEDYPTAEYIATYNEAYHNPNLTTWVDDYGQTMPKNSLVDGC
ncbi:beta-glucan synthesis-associated [Desarmillaria tabescens]|uniref:Beta-glucan synthesis-associated n=1 Tax=Armillaria tabescens TaxID=1929756 RepID=A0AA39TPK8_ARMTA|nr:beta-glucan synthesis-associated [Desarmillaria tabescens]KAK0461998.1 beta-glucan synthesis-associated [Desarmillaria tabescens]